MTKIEKFAEPNGGAQEAAILCSIPKRRMPLSDFSGSEASEVTKPKIQSPRSRREGRKTITNTKPTGLSSSATLENTAADGHKPTDIHSDPAIAAQDGKSPGNARKPTLSPTLPVDNFHEDGQTKVNNQNAPAIEGEAGSGQRALETHTATAASGHSISESEGQFTADTQKKTAFTPDRAGGHELADNLSTDASGSPLIENIWVESQYQPAFKIDPISYSPLLAELRALWRQRYAWVKARTALTLAGQARCRAFSDGDKGAASELWAAYKKGVAIDPFLAITLEPFKQGIALFDTYIKPVEKRLEKIVMTLPLYPWLKAYRGIDAIFIAGLYGEARDDLSAYRSPSALWKRFGLAVFDGERQAFKTDKQENERHNYSAKRRALISQIEKQFLSKKHPMRALYDERKAYELGNGIKKGHAHNRALRYCGKRFLRELWKEARRIGHDGQRRTDTQRPIAIVPNNSESQTCTVPQKPTALHGEANGHEWDANQSMSAIPSPSVSESHKKIATHSTPALQGGELATVLSKPIAPPPIPRRLSLKKKSPARTTA